MTETLVSALLETVCKHPQRPAVRCRDQQLSYRELEQSARELAGTMQSRGLKAGETVAIYLPKSIESIVGVYAALMSGAAFVPIDPQLPAERVAFLLDDCSVRHIVTQPQKLATLAALPEAQRASLAIYGAEPGDSGLRTIGWDDVAAGAALFEAAVIEPDDVAYIMYTSGSTGHPKGIVHTHRSGLAYAVASAVAFEVCPEDRIAGFAPLHFDQSTFHLFSGPLRGAATVLIPDEYGSFPVDLARLIESEAITIWYSVPYVLIQLANRGALEDRDLGALRWVKFGGEPFPPKHLRRFMAHAPDARYANIYGPAEVNHCTDYVLPGAPSDDQPLPIGKPWAAADILIVDADDREVAMGESGELLVATDTMMRGYWARPDLDERAFSFPEGQEGRRFYRTGDLVCQRPDGLLDFLGRKDRQVKARGYRIELDEVEAALQAHADVVETAVYTLPADDGGKLLEASVIKREDSELSRGDLLQHLQSRLPRYAIPSEFRFTTTFPRTGSGKIDRRKLAESRRQEQKTGPVT